MRTLLVSGPGGPTRVDIDPAGAVSIEGVPEPVRAIAAGPGTCRVLVGATQHVAHVADAGDTCWVFVDGETWELDVGRGGPVRARAAAAGDALAAPMPATVARILTEPGRAVRRGDTLLVLEAMKMELPVRAPGDGRIVDIRCREGDLVAAGAILVKIEA